MKYTRGEIEANIKRLEDTNAKLDRERSTISTQIKRNKKAIEYWESLDESQLKMF